MWLPIYKEGMTQNSENSRFTGRLGRYARVTTAMTGLATKLAGEKFLGIKIERDQHAKQLTEALGNLKGPLMKVGQILSTIPEAVPAEYARELQQLQSDAPPMGWAFVRRRMKTELGADWQTKFKSFEQDAAAAASLGQVHKAVSLEGKNLACKLQYPDMQSAIQADLRQLKLIFSIYETYDKSLSTKHIYKELAARLNEELDYQREARASQLYRYMLKDEEHVHIPQVLPELSTDRLLTSTWLEGKKILSFVDADLETRNTLAFNMFRAWYVPLYYYGVIHGDPHLGNYTIRDDLSVNLLDFGCIRIFRPEFVGGVIDLYRALQNEDNDLAVHAYETWGFENLTKELVEILNIWAKFLYGPILEDKTRVIGTTEHGVYGRETAQEVHKKLKSAAAGIAVPQEFVFMDRAALGLGSVFIHLQSEINWYQLFNELIEGFDTKKLKAQQDEAVAKFDLMPSINDDILMGK